jgi:hypothetical protein
LLLLLLFWLTSRGSKTFRVHTKFVFDLFCDCCGCGCYCPSVIFSSYQGSEHFKPL